MLAKTETGFAAEMKIVPTWAYVVAGILFIGAQILFNAVLARLPDAPPAAFLAFLGLLAGLLLACILLFIGYINRDAKRRGMSPTLWTIVAVLIPNALGIILYFILRQPLQMACPQCGHAVQTGFNFCPGCSCKLNPSCPRCQRVIGVNDVYCPYCGTGLENPRGQVSAPPAGQAG
jgi:RNA polymerase subunit RPABC4/transcription elongation factor Spt4